MKQDNIDFLGLAAQALKGLPLSDWRQSQDVRCRGEVHYILKRGRVTIDMGYEPYGPPWCYVLEGKDLKKTICPTASNQFGEFLATGPMTDALLSTHEEDVRHWLAAAVSEIEKELK